MEQTEYNNTLDISYSSVISEARTEYTGYNLKTALKMLIDKQIVITKYAKSQASRDRIKKKISLARQIILIETCRTN